jgi:RND family efflux transporter MFP subunit
MKKYIFLWLTLGLFYSCKQDDNSLDAKKKALAQLRSEASEIQNKIKKLEEEIAVLDTSASGQEKVKQVMITDLTKSEFRHFVAVQGMLEAEENLMVSSKMPGMIREVKVNEGDVVSKGQVLALLDDEVLRKSIDEVKAALAQVNVLFDKQKQLWDQKIGTEFQYLTVKNQKEGLENKLQTLEAQLSQSAVTAPFSGIIDAVMAKPGSAAAPGVPLMHLVNTSQLKATAKVPDSYVAFVKNGDKVVVNFPDLNKDVEASVAFVSKVIDPLSRTFRIEVKIPSGDAAMKPNLLSVVRINDKTIANAIVIDENIIQPTEAGKILFVAGMEKGKTVALQRLVTTGLSYNGKVEILTGLQEGDKLITTGYQDLSDKQAIRY